MLTCVHGHPPQPFIRSAWSLPENSDSAPAALIQPNGVESLLLWATFPVSRWQWAMFRSTARSRSAERQRDSKNEVLGLPEWGWPTSLSGSCSGSELWVSAVQKQGKQATLQVLGILVFFLLTKDWTIFPLSHWAPYLFLRTLLPWWLSGKEPACNAGDPGLIAGWGRSPRERNDSPLQYSCLENSMDRGAWWATVQRMAKSWTWLSDLTLSLSFTFSWSSSPVYKFHFA